MTITLAPVTATDSDCGDNFAVGLDLEADVGFFSMSPASAEQVTVQIRTVLDRAWEFIALAYKEKAFLALGYASWDEYVDARFGDLRLAVPREHRTQVVATSRCADVRPGDRQAARCWGGHRAPGIGALNRCSNRNTSAAERRVDVGPRRKVVPTRPAIGQPCLLDLCGDSSGQGR